MISKRTILKAPPEVISSWGWGGVGKHMGSMGDEFLQSDGYIGRLPG